MAEFNLANLTSGSNKFVLYMVPVQCVQNVIVPNNSEEIVGTSSSGSETTVNDPLTSSDDEVEVISEAPISIRSSPLILCSDTSTVRLDDSSWFSEPSTSDYESQREYEVTHVPKRLRCSTVLITSGSNAFPENPTEIRCLCRVNTKLESMELINCNECKTNQHLACNGYTKSSSVPRPYFCHWCQKHQTEGTSDIRMEVQRENDRQMLALIRLFTIYYEKHNEIQGVLDGIAPAERNMVLNTFRKWDFLQINQNGHYTFSEGFSQKVLNSVYFYKAPRIVTGVHVLE